MSISIHPSAERRVIFVGVALVMAVAFHGSRQLQGADRVAPVIFAAAAGLCVSAAVRVTSCTLWLFSGFAVFLSFLWRLGQIIATDLSLTEQEPPDSVAMASAAYVFCLFSTLGLWQWRLRPGPCDGVRVDDE